MFFGHTPFFADSVVETYGKIVHFKEHFSFPLSVTDVPEEARALIQGLICPRETRLGRNGVQDFREHPFFAGVDWEGLLCPQPLGCSWGTLHCGYSPPPRPLSGAKLKINFQLPLSVPN
uniref:Uncharacterized protein n=1 Tax=Pelusios castaneus TaxID=367368 RepID=A0A8C8VIQ6_9SAUR